MWSYVYLSNNFKAIFLPCCPFLSCFPTFFIPIELIIVNKNIIKIYNINMYIWIN